MKKPSHFVKCDKAVSLKEAEPWNGVQINLNVSKECALVLRRLACQNSKSLRDLGILSLSFGNGHAINLTDSGINSTLQQDISPISPVLSGKTTPFQRSFWQPAALRDAWSHSDNFGCQSIDNENDFPQPWQDWFLSRRTNPKYLGGRTTGRSVRKHTKGKQFQFPAARSKKSILRDNGVAFNIVSGRLSHFCSNDFSECANGDSCVLSAPLATSHDNHPVVCSSQRKRLQYNREPLNRNCNSSVSNSICSSELWQRTSSGQYHNMNLKQNKIAFEESEYMSPGLNRLSCQAQHPSKHLTRNVCTPGIRPDGSNPSESYYLTEGNFRSSSSSSLFSPSSLEEMSVSGDHLRATPCVESSNFAVESAWTLLSDNFNNGSVHEGILDSSRQLDLRNQDLKQMRNHKNSTLKFRGLSSKSEGNISDLIYNDKSVSFEYSVNDFSKSLCNSEALGNQESYRSVCRSANFGSSTKYFRTDAKSDLCTYSAGYCADSHFCPISNLHRMSRGPNRYLDSYLKIMDCSRGSGDASFSETLMEFCGEPTSPFSSMAPLLSPPTSAVGDPQSCQTFGHQRVDSGAEFVWPGSLPLDDYAWNESDLCVSIPDSGIASRTSSGGSDFSELERTLRGSAEKLS